MEQISSGYTLFLKIVFPTFWFVFFGLFGLGAIFLNDGRNSLLASSYFQIGYFVVFLLFGAMIYLTAIQLKRVDMNKSNVYISNYFKTYRYDYEGIDSINLQKYVLFTLGTITLKDKGKLGSKIRFLVRKKVFHAFAEANSLQFKRLLSKSSMSA